MAPHARVHLVRPLTHAGVLLWFIRYHVVFLALVVPATLFGGMLATRKQAPTAADMGRVHP